MINHRQKCLVGAQLSLLTQGPTSDATSYHTSRVTQAPRRCCDQERLATCPLWGVFWQCLAVTTITLPNFWCHPGTSPAKWCRPPDSAASEAGNVASDICHQHTNINRPTHWNSSPVHHSQPTHWNSSPGHQCHPTNWNSSPVHQRQPTHWNSLLVHQRQPTH